MASSRRASAQGLKIVDQARRRKHWTKKSLVWCEEAKVREATLQRFWGRQPIREENFINICRAVGIHNWEDIAEPQTYQVPIQDLTQAPDTYGLYGRITELQQLNTLVVDEKCRVLALCGMGGIGKSALAAMLVYGILSKFEYVIWHNLHDAPALIDILSHLLQFFGVAASNGINERVSQLINCLRTHRCLIVLDEFDTLLQSATLAGEFCQGYEAYSDLLQRIGKERHQGCLLLTSREKPNIIHLLTTYTLAVRSFNVQGLDYESARKLLIDTKVIAQTNQLQEIINICSGHPFTLKIVAANIQEVFNGDVSCFLEHGTFSSVNIDSLLHEHISCLSDLERRIMYLLADNEEYITSFQQLRQQLEIEVSNHQLQAALRSLIWRSLIAACTEGAAYTLQPLVRRYLQNN
jgi:hypothetical protein